MADTPQERAEAAAEQLAAEGQAVTARTVQRRARVDMNVASRVAREWNQAQAAIREVPPVPTAVLNRMEGVWREAVEAARIEHAADREGWAARIAAGEEERDALADALDSLEKERAAQAEEAEREAGQLRERISELEANVEQLRSELASAHDARAAAEAKALEADTRATQAEGVASGLREALAAIKPDATA